MKVTFTSNEANVSIGKWKWPAVGYSITIDISLLDNAPTGDLALLKRAVALKRLAADQSLSGAQINSTPVDANVWREVKAVVEPDGDVVLVAEGLGPIAQAGGSGGQVGTSTVVNDLTTGGGSVALSAEQGKVLQQTKYEKPAGGIPASDLSLPVQSAITLASTALQSAPVTSVAGKTGTVTLTKADVGLSNVSNTADADKPVSTAQAAAISAKYTRPAGGIPQTDLAADVRATLDAVATKAPAGAGTLGTYTKADVGLADVDNTADIDKPVSTAQAAALAQKAPAGTGPAGVYTKSDIGLSNVDNTADIDKPISTAQAAAISAKYTKPGGGIPLADLASAVQNALPSVDGSNNVSVGPTVFIPSGAYSFEKLLSTNGAVLNGTSDDSAAFQAALDALPSNRWNEVQIPERVASVKFNSGITLDVTKTYLRFMGATMDFTGMTSGQALTITGSGVNNTYGQVMGGLERAFIAGPGRLSAVDGVLFTGSGVASPNTGSARSMFNSCWIRNWRKAVTYYHRSYLTTMFNCEVGSSLIGVYSASTAYDAYENAAFVRGVIGNNDVNVYVEDGLVTMFGTSIDYAEWVQLAVRAGSLQLSHFFIEYSIRNNRYGTPGGIYSGNAPLCAFDLQPGTTSALRNDIGLYTTAASAGSNWSSLRMNGGQWVVKDPRAGDSANNTLMCHVNQGGNGYFGTSGRPHIDFNGFGTQSGYICHNLTSYNAVGGYTSPCEWDPGFYNGSSDVPNQIVDNVTSYLTGNTTQGLSVSPAHNLLGSYGISGTNGIFSFEKDGEYSDNVTIVEDSNGSTALVLPLNRINGSAGSVSSSATFSHTGSKSLKITKTGAAGQPFKVAIDVDITSLSMHRKVFRGVVARPTTGGASAGSFNVNLAFIRDEVARVSDTGTIYTATSNGYLVTGGAATNASAAATHSASVFKATSGSLYANITDLTAGTWYAWQLNSQPDTLVPGWAKKLRIEIDLKNMGPGDICFDSLDLQAL